MQLEKLIKKDVRKWSQHFLEIPNKHLGGFPACPFAKKTWDDKKDIRVDVKIIVPKGFDVFGKKPLK